MLGFAAAGSALAGTARADEAAPAAEVPSFLAEPQIGAIAETVDTDVVVVGLGIAGVGAVRIAGKNGSERAAEGLFGCPGASRPR